ncbi:MAG: sodium:alanine symporter family protein [Clostridia bacterium]|nr:sodium:alanine symporter family protein [Clostridia bacterium]
MVSKILWGPGMVFLLLFVGIFYTVILKGFQFAHIKDIFSKTIGSIFKKTDTSSGGISPFAAISTALAGTIGTGNIAGVATAIVAGGPGSIFWMWISGFIGMITKYAEVVLAMKYRILKNGRFCGGPMYYIEKGTGMKWLGFVFAVLCILVSFAMGATVQSNSIADSLELAFGFSKPAVGLIIAAICGFAIIGGAQRIVKVTEFVVPFMAIFYIGGCAFFLFVKASYIPCAFTKIFRDAFDFKSAGGGLLGFGVSRAMRFGISRGIFTHEAGLGAASIAHSASNEKDPAVQGMWGIFEVFFDTILICTITALVILTSGASGSDGSVLTALSFSAVFGDFGIYFIAIAITFFATASILGWAFYGGKALEYISNGNLPRKIFKTFFILSVFAGTCINMQSVWEISDILNGLIALPNLAALILLAPEVVKITNEYKKR